MTKPPRRQFSLLTLFFLLTTAALLCSNVVMMRRVDQAQAEAAQARAELDQTRRRFGYLRIDDPNLIHISRIESGGMSTGRNWQNSYRLYVPPGHRFLLKVAETEISDTGEFATPGAAKTLVMNSWNEGADLILNWQIQYEEDVPHLKVATDSEQLFDYAISAWKAGAGGGGMHDAYRLTTEPQKTFRPKEEIRFMWSRDMASKRGVVFWMEPLPSP